MSWITKIWKRVDIYPLLYLIPWVLLGLVIYNTQFNVGKEPDCGEINQEKKERIFDEGVKYAIDVIQYHRVPDLDELENERKHRIKQLD